MKIKNQDERDKEFIQNVIKSHIEFLTEKRNSLKSAFVHCLDSKAVLELLPDDILVQEAHEEWKDHLQYTQLEYINAQTDFYKVLKKLAEQYPSIFINQDSHKNEWLFAYQYFERWYKEYRMGEI